MRIGLVRGGRGAGNLKLHGGAGRHRVDVGHDALLARGFALRPVAGGGEAAVGTKDIRKRVAAIETVRRGVVERRGATRGNDSGTVQCGRPLRMAALAPAIRLVGERVGNDEIRQGTVGVVGNRYAIADLFAHVDAHIAVAGDPVAGVRVIDGLTDADVCRLEDDVFRIVLEGHEAGRRAQFRGQRRLREGALLIAEGDAGFVVHIGGDGGFGIDVGLVDEPAGRGDFRLQRGIQHLAGDGEHELVPIAKPAGHGSGDNLADHAHGHGRGRGFVAVQGGARRVRGVVEHGKPVGNDVGDDGVFHLGIILGITRAVAGHGDGVVDHVARLHGDVACLVAADARGLLNGDPGRIFAFDDSHIRRVRRIRRGGGGGGPLIGNDRVGVGVDNPGRIRQLGDGHDGRAALLPDVEGDGDRAGLEAGFKIAIRALVGDAEALIIAREGHGALLVKADGVCCYIHPGFVFAIPAGNHGGDSRSFGRRCHIAVVRRSAVAGRADGEAGDAPVHRIGIHRQGLAGGCVGGGGGKGEGVVCQLRLVHRQGHDVGKVGDGKGYVLAALLLEAAHLRGIRALGDGGGHVCGVGQVGKDDHGSAAVAFYLGLALGFQRGDVAQHAGPIEEVFGQRFLRHRIVAGDDVFKEEHGVAGAPVGIIAVDVNRVLLAVVRERPAARRRCVHAAGREGFAVFRRGGKAAANGRVFGVGVVVLEHRDAAVGGVVGGQRNIRVLFADDEEAICAPVKRCVAFTDLDQVEHVAAILDARLLDGVAGVARELVEVCEGELAVCRGLGLKERDRFLAVLALPDQIELEGRAGKQVIVVRFEGGGQGVLGQGDVDGGGVDDGGHVCRLRVGHDLDGLTVERIARGRFCFDDPEGHAFHCAVDVAQGQRRRGRGDTVAATLEYGRLAIAAPGAAAHPVVARVRISQRIVEVELCAVNGLRVDRRIVGLLHGEGRLVPLVGDFYLDGLILRVRRGDFDGNRATTAIQPCLIFIVLPVQRVGDGIVGPGVGEERFGDGIDPLGQFNRFRTFVSRERDGRGEAGVCARAFDGEVRRIGRHIVGVAIKHLRDGQVTLAGVDDLPGAEDFPLIFGKAGFLHRLAGVFGDHLEDDGFGRHVALGIPLSELVPAGHEVGGADHAVLRGVGRLAVGHTAPAAVRRGVRGIGLVQGGKGLELDIEGEASGGEARPRVVHLGELEAALAGVCEGDGLHRVIVKGEGFAAVLFVDPGKVGLFRIGEVAAHNAGFDDGIVAAGGQEHFDVLASRGGRGDGRVGRLHDRAVIPHIGRDDIAALRDLEGGRDLGAIRIDLSELQRAILHVVDDFGLRGVDGLGGGVGGSGFGGTGVGRAGFLLPTDAALIFRRPEGAGGGYAIFVFVAGGKRRLLPVVDGIGGEIEAHAAIGVCGERLDILREALVGGDGDLRAGKRGSGFLRAIDVAVLLEDDDDLVGKYVLDGALLALGKAVVYRRIVIRQPVVIRVVCGKREGVALGTLGRGVARPLDLAEEEGGAVFAVDEFTFIIVLRVDDFHRALILILFIQAIHADGLGDGAPGQVSRALRQVHAGGEGGDGFQFAAIRAKEHELEGGIGKVNRAGRLAILIVGDGDLVQLHLHIADDAGAFEGDVFHLKIGFYIRVGEARPAVGQFRRFKTRGRLDLEEGIIVASRGERGGDQPAVAHARSRAGFVDVAVGIDRPRLDVQSQRSLYLFRRRPVPKFANGAIDVGSNRCIAAVEKELGAVEVDLVFPIRIIQVVVIFTEGELRIGLEVDELRALRKGGGRGREVHARGAVGSEDLSRAQAIEILRARGEDAINDFAIPQVGGGFVAGVVAQLDNDIVGHAVQPGEGGGAIAVRNYGDGLIILGDEFELLLIVFGNDLIDGQPRPAGEGEFARVARGDFPLAVGVLLHVQRGLGHVCEGKGSAVDAVAEREGDSLRLRRGDVALGRGGFHDGVGKLRIAIHAVPVKDRQVFDGYAVGCAILGFGGEDVVVGSTPRIQGKAGCLQKAGFIRTQPGRGDADREGRAGDGRARLGVGLGNDEVALVGGVGDGDGVGRTVRVRLYLIGAVVDLAIDDLNAGGRLLLIDIIRVNDGGVGARFFPDVVGTGRGKGQLEEAGIGEGAPHRLAIEHDLHEASVRSPLIDGELEGIDLIADRGFARELLGQLDLRPLVVLEGGGRAVQRREREGERELIAAVLRGDRIASLLRRIVHSDGGGAAEQVASGHGGFGDGVRAGGQSAEDDLAVFIRRIFHRVSAGESVPVGALRKVQGTILALGADGELRILQRIAIQVGLKDGEAGFVGFVDDNRPVRGEVCRRGEIEGNRAPVDRAFARVNDSVAGGIARFNDVVPDWAIRIGDGQQLVEGDEAFRIARAASNSSRSRRRDVIVDFERRASGGGLAVGEILVDLLEGQRALEDVGEGARLCRIVVL